MPRPDPRPDALNEYGGPAQALADGGLELLALLRVLDLLQVHADIVNRASGGGHSQVGCHGQGPDQGGDAPAAGSGLTRGGGVEERSNRRRVIVGGHWFFPRLGSGAPLRTRPSSARFSPHFAPPASC